MRITIVAASLGVALGTWALAGKPAGTPVVAADGSTTFKIIRNLSDDAKPVDVALKLPPGWKWNAPSTKEVSGSYEFGPRSAALGGPTIAVTVRIDNRDPSEVAGVAKAAATELKEHVPGGGKVAQWISDARPVELGPHTHGYVTSAEIDATAERHQHYWETSCYAYRDDNRFVFTIVASAHEQDKGLVAAFEKVCESIRLK